MLPTTALHMVQSEREGERRRRRNRALVLRAARLEMNMDVKTGMGESTDSVLQIGTSPTLMCFGVTRESC